MAKFTVFYRTPEEFKNSFAVTPANIDASHYQKIGCVEADDLEDLFRRMNAVDGSDLEYVGRGPGKLAVRSLSVGDVAINELGRGLLCGIIGWQAFDATTFTEIT